MVQTSLPHLGKPTYQIERDLIVILSEVFWPSILLTTGEQVVRSEKVDVREIFAAARDTGSAGAVCFEKAWLSAALGAKTLHSGVTRQSKRNDTRTTSNIESLLLRAVANCTVRVYSDEDEHDSETLKMVWQ